VTLHHMRTAVMHVACTMTHAYKFGTNPHECICSAHLLHVIPGLKRGQETTTSGKEPSSSSATMPALNCGASVGVD